MRTSIKNLKRMFKELESALSVSSKEANEHIAKAEKFFSKHTGLNVTLGCYKDSTWALSGFFNDKSGACRWLFLPLQLEEWLDTPSKVIERTKEIINL